MGGPDASVRCVRCGEPLAGVTSDYCPRCGMPVSASLGIGVGQLPQAPAPAAPELAGSVGVPTMGAGGYEAPLFPPAPPPAASYPQYPQAEQPQQPPTYPPYPPYSQPAAPSTPLYPPAGYPTGYPQFAPSSAPFSGQYGQPAGPSVPYYGPPGTLAPWTVPLAPAKKGRTGLIVGLLVALLVVVAGGGTAAVLALSHSGTGSTNPGPNATTGPTATPTPHIAFQDPLNTNVNGWLVNGSCFFGADGYHIKGGWLCFAPAGEFADATISVAVRQVAGPLRWYYGLAIRHVSNGNYYSFAITSDGYWKFFKVVSGTVTALTTDMPSSAIHDGLNVTNTLQVAASGSHFDFSINGTHVGSADDSTFTSQGKCGVIGNATAGVDVVFTNFTIATAG